MSNRNGLSAYVPPDPDFSGLPVTFHIGATPLFGLVLMIAGFAGPIVVGGMLWLIGLVAVNMPDNWGWIVLGFSAIPLLAIPWGWFVLHSRTVVQVGADMVSYRRETPLRNREWQAPLAEFTGVAYRRILPPSRSKAETTMHGVELCHGPGYYDLRLVQATDEALAREVQARLAELTGLPAIERDAVRS